MGRTKQEIAALDALATQNLVGIINDVQFSSLILNEQNFLAKRITFKDVSFSSELILKRVNLPAGITFVDCNFNGPVIFEGIKSNWPIQISADEKPAIVFTNCKFSGEFLFENFKEVLLYRCKFIECIFTSGLKIDNVQFADIIEFSNCTVEKKLRITYSKSNSPIWFTGNIFNGNLDIDTIAASDITFYSGNEFKSSVLLHDCDLPNGLSIFNSSFTGQLDMTCVRTVSIGLRISGCSFLQAVNIDFQTSPLAEPTGFESIILSDTKFADGIYINGLAREGKVKPRVTFVDVNLSNLLSGNITFTQLDIGYLKLYGYNSLANLAFRNIDCHMVDFDGLINESGLILSDFQAATTWPNFEKDVEISKSQFKISDSNLGRAQLLRTNFGSFDRFEFHNVIFLDIYTSMVEWPSFKQIDADEVYKLEKEIKEVKRSRDISKHLRLKAELITLLIAKKEIYRQLKLAYQRQGDLPQSHLFQQGEMKYYLKILAYERPRKYSEYLILLSNWTNNFGQSWLRALGLLFVCSFVCYSFVAILTSDRLDQSQPLDSWNDFYQNILTIVYYDIKKWIVILNPAHYLKDIHDEVKSLSFWVYLCDFISRIVVSYFIFQVISAFRKFSK